MKSRRKKENKGYLQFAALIMAGGVIGGVGSTLMNFYESDMEQAADIIENGIRIYSPYFLIIFAVAGSFLNACLMLKAKRNLRNWNGEDEEQAEAIERYNNRCQGIISVLTILNLSVFVPCLLDTERLVLVMISYFFFIVYGIWCALTINRLVEYQKIMNPEKKGNALTLHFDKEWLASCDEREKVKMFEAAYNVYRRSQYIFGGVLIMLMMVSVVVRIGFLPFFVIGFIWAAQTIIYFRSYGKI